MTLEDCINRQAAIDACLNGWNKDYKEIVKEIRALPSIMPQPRWIPADERLPEEDTNVLCWYEYFRYGNYNKMYQTYGIGTYLGRFGWAGDITGDQARVIAWMPLPEPYKTESEVSNAK